MLNRHRIRVPPSGVLNVSEPVEISRENWEVRNVPHKVRSLLNTAKADSTIGSRMREICLSGSEEGLAGVTWRVYSPKPRSNVTVGVPEPV